MSNHGRNLYVPKNILQELDILSQRNERKKKKPYKEAWDRLLFYTKVGRNVDDVYSVFFGKAKR